MNTELKAHRQKLKEKPHVHGKATLTNDLVKKKDFRMRNYVPQTNKLPSKITVGNKGILQL